MNNFEQWADDYASRFPGVGNLLAESKSMQEDWQAVLGDYSIDVLKQAARWITLLDPQPYPSEHLAKLSARCQMLTYQPRAADKPYDLAREPRYRCLTCLDSGVVEVYQDSMIDALKNGTFEISKHFRTHYTACNCNAGNVLATGRGGTKNDKGFPPTRRFHDALVPIKPFPIDQQITLLIEELNLTLQPCH